MKTNLPNTPKALLSGLIIFFSLIFTPAWSQSTDATLKDISVGGVRITNFTAAILSYDIVLDFGTTVPPIVTAIATSSHAVVFITQAPSVTGSATILVTAQDGVTKLTYTVNFSVFPIAQTNAFLKDLLVDGVSVAGFDRKTMNYNVSLPYGTLNVPVVTALVDEPHATTEITQASSLTGTAVVVVTAQDGTTKMTYSVIFSITPPSADATLSDLKVGPNTVLGFNSNIIDYNVLLPAATIEVPVVSAVVTEPHAHTVITQSASDTGSASVVVTAQDGITVKTYTVNFSLASSVATLSDLKVGPNTISGFASNVFDYNELLPAGTSVVPTVTATVTESHANAVITEAASVSGTTTIVVTAQDGTTTKTYTVNFSLPTGINSDTGGQLKIDMLNQAISIRSADNISFLEISDIQGKLMFSRKVDSTETLVDTENWKSGIYIFKIGTPTGIVNKKISVIK
jgi:hypothetical protein